MSIYPSGEKSQGQASGFPDNQTLLATDANLISDKIEALEAAGSGDITNNFIQGAGADEAFGYPFATVYNENMQEASTTITAFNGGVVSYTQGNGYAEVTNTANSRGFRVSYNNLSSTNYILKLNIETTITDAQVDIYSEWPEFVQSVNGTGEYFIPFTSEVTAGGRVTITSPDSTDLKVYAVAIALPIESTLIARTEDIQTTIEKNLSKDSGLIYYNDFDNAFSIDDINFQFQNGSTKTLDLANKKASFSLDDSSAILFGDVSENKTKKFTRVSFLISNLVGSFYIRGKWGDTNFVNIDSDGFHSIDLDIIGGTDSVTLGRLLFRNETGSVTSFDLHNITISSYDNKQDLEQHKREVQIGYGAINSYNNNIDNPEDKGVVIGYNSKSDSKLSTSIGVNSNTEHTGFYGVVSGIEMLAVGHLAKSCGWRNTSIGAKAFAGGQSSTSLGAGACSFSSHEVALGRGSHGNPLNKGETTTGDSTVSHGSKMYFSNGWGHYYNTPPSGISINGTSSPKVPSSIEVGIIGQSAYDGRYPIYDAGTAYSLDDKVREGDVIYNCIQAGTGNLPSTSPTFWETLTLGDGSVYEVPSSEGSQGDTPAENAVAGGHIYLQSGYGTGGQDGGEVRIYSTPSNGTEGDNEQSQKTLEAKFTSDSSVVDGSRFYLLDTSDNTLKRVEFGADDSAGAGYKVLRVLN